MKKILILICLLTNVCLCVDAQFVYTCKNGSIDASIISLEFTQADKNELVNDLINPNGTYYYLGITLSDILASASMKYNCHAYAGYIFCSRKV
jgi:hypothetical protein